MSDNADAVCNNGWIMFQDYVLVIDANFPAGAKLIISKIRALTDKPIRFALDTHHHGDHAYGNQIFVENGGVPVAHTGVIEEMKRYETGYYAHEPGRWEAATKDRPDLRTTKLKPPSVLFSKDLIFDDGKHRVELMHLGVAHTHGDAVAWLPKEGRRHSDQEPARGGKDSDRVDPRDAEIQCADCALRQRARSK